MIQVSNNIANFSALLHHYTTMVIMVTTMVTMVTTMVIIITTMVKAVKKTTTSGVSYYTIQFVEYKSCQQKNLTFF